MLPAYVLSDKIVIVIVPLVFLRKDLLRRCAEVGLQASLRNARNIAGAKVIIVSAEHLASKPYQAFVKEIHVTNRLHAIFVDEAHLLLLWRDFRESMRYFGSHIRPDKLAAPLIALTATAPPSIEKQLATSCVMRGYKLICRATARHNICYEVRDVMRNGLFRNVDAALCAAFGNAQNVSVGAKAIVYVQTQNDCDILTLTLNAFSPGRPCFKYHAGMTDEERESAEATWERNSGRISHVMVATYAFRYGIDVPDIRIVVHAGCPRRLTEYLQESGRVGLRGLLL